jgi:hypothetical protein
VPTNARVSYDKHSILPPSTKQTKTFIISLSLYYEVIGVENFHDGMPQTFLRRTRDSLGVGIGNAALHGLGKQPVEGSDIGESARAFESLEKMAWLDVSHPLVGMELEELLSGGGTAQTAQNAQLAIKDVGNIGAPVLACGFGIELENIREEPRGKLIINVLR